MDKNFSRQDVETLLRNNGKDIGRVLDIQVDSYTTGGRGNGINQYRYKWLRKLTKESIRTFFKTNGASLESRKFHIVKDGTTNNSSFSIIGGNNSISSSLSLNQVYILGADGNITNLSYDNLSIKVEGKNGQEILSFSNSDSVSGDFVFVGRGRGHGVGMSQWGAKGMAESGFNYKQILAHYFNGAQIR